jgi:type IV secretory pathway TraG/TraD family ATPase VirD4
MLGGFGTEYFSKEQILYVYHSLNGRVERAEYYRDKNIANELKWKEQLKNLKTEEEIAKLAAEDTVPDSEKQSDN